MAGPGMAYRQIEHGVVIIATGGEEYKPEEYLYGQDKRVMTQQELEASIARRDINPGNTGDVVMIQCVGSRIEERPYCSRLCCSAAIKNALKIKEANPAYHCFYSLPGHSHLWAPGRILYQGTQGRDHLYPL